MRAQGKFATLVTIALLLAASGVAFAMGPTDRGFGTIEPPKGADAPLGPGVPPEAVGGPDAFGYTFIDSNEGGGPAFSWVEINGTGTSVALGDDATGGPFSIGFNFPFYGGSFSQFFISSNGWISFTSPGSSDLSNDCPINSGSQEGNIIALMWDDLDPGDNAELVYYESFGAGSCPYVPSNVPGTPACLVVEYDNFSHFPGGNGDAGTFEAILYDSGQVLIQFLDSGLEMGSGSTTGISPAAGTPGVDPGLTYACDTGGSLTDSLAVLFELGPNADLSITKTGDVVMPGGVTTFTLDVSNLGPDDQTGVEVTDVLDANFTFVGDSCGGVLAANTWTWTIGNLANGASVSCELQVELNTPDCVAVVNTATVSGDLPDGDASNNSSTVANGGTNAVMDPGFELGTPNGVWTEASTNFGTPLCDVPGCGTGTGTGPRTGAWWCWFGGIAAFEEGSVSQTIVIPTGATTLTFWLEMIVCASPGDFMEVLVDGNQEFLVDGSSPLCGMLGYSQQSVDISAYADGGMHTIEFHSISGTAGTTNFFVDDLDLPSAPTCVDIPPPPSALPIPTLDVVGLGLLVLLLAAGGLLLLRRVRPTTT